MIAPEGTEFGATPAAASDPAPRPFGCSSPARHHERSRSGNFRLASSVHLSLGASPRAFGLDGHIDAGMRIGRRRLPVESTAAAECSPPSRPPNTPPRRGTWDFPSAGPSGVGQLRAVGRCDRRRRRVHGCRSTAAHRRADVWPSADVNSWARGPSWQTRRGAVSGVPPGARAWVQGLAKLPATRSPRGVEADTRCQVRTRPGTGECPSADSEGSCRMPGPRRRRPGEVDGARRRRQTETRALPSGHTRGCASGNRQTTLSDA